MKLLLIALLLGMIALMACAPIKDYGTFCASKGYNDYANYRGWEGWHCGATGEVMCYGKTIPTYDDGYTTSEEYRCYSNVPESN